jgi:hypothetical protein
MLTPKQMHRLRLRMMLRLQRPKKKLQRRLSKILSVRNQKRGKKLRSKNLRSKLRKSNKRSRFQPSQ